ncbi:MAG: GNAT family N-acetyltransferase [Spirulina sp. SIO3F2]|nr:GNAT family N-acetyltransferase [Spirulina sp. SIO3F2]
MIRPITPEDTSALLALAEATGLFQPPELQELSEAIAAALEGTLGSNHTWLTDEDGGELVSVAYYAPEPMTRGTWNLYLIAVHPQHQRQGRGAALLRHIEQTLNVKGERMLIVETAGLPSFAGTRAFYRTCGYTEEARIRDFYQAGEDKIVYRKLLQDATATYKSENASA